MERNSSSRFHSCLIPLRSTRVLAEAQLASTNECSKPARMTILLIERRVRPTEKCLVSSEDRYDATLIQPSALVSARL
ncbi:hypothetical protein BURKHO8Y_20070 [Burkholderia sp. 8Y]|nr:hypothetical protein BURKHO8Y_20070 [Burkholderia sp. 8Y]